MPGRRGSAFDPIHLPDHIWREHEYALRDRDIGALFRLAKRYAGASQNRIAALTGVPQSRVNALMNGRSGPVSNIEVLERIADGLTLSDRARVLLGLAPRSTDPTGADPAPSVAVSRPISQTPPGATPSLAADQADQAQVQELLAYAAKVTMGVRDPHADRLWRTHGDVPTPVPSRVGSQDIEQIEQITATLRTADQLHGGGACRDAVIAQARWVTQLLEVPAAADVVRRLHLTLADLYSFTGWTSMDIGLYACARSHFARALTQAQEAGDPALVANVLYGTGRLHLHQRLIAQALRFFQLGQIAAQDSGCSLTVARLCANEAWAYSMLGDRAQAVRFLHRAADEFARAEPGATSAWVRSFTAADLDAMTGMTHLELAVQDPADHLYTARDALTRSLAGRSPGMARIRAFERSALAVVLLRGGEEGEGVAVGWQAAELAERIRSSRVRDRLRPLAEQAARATSSDAADLAHHLTGLCS